MNTDRLALALMSYMSTHSAEDGAAIADTTLATNHFFNMVRGRLHYRAMYDPDFKFVGPERDAHIVEAIDFFLRGALER